MPLRLQPHASKAVAPRTFPAAQVARQANEAWQEGLAANGVTLSEQVCELEANAACDPMYLTCNPM